MIFNDATILLELLRYYTDALSKPKKGTYSSDEVATTEMKLRVVGVQKVMFIQMRSSIEYCCKEYVRRNPDKLTPLKKKRRIYYIVMPNHIHAIIQITNPVGDDLCVVPDQNRKPNRIINKNDLTDDGQRYMVTYGHRITGGYRVTDRHRGLSLQDVYHCQI